MKLNLPLKTLLTLLVTCSVITSCKHQEQNAAAQTPAVKAPRAGYPDGPPLNEGSAPAPAPAAGSEPKTGVQTTFSGLKYEVLKPGTGRQPTKYNKVKVNYRGYFTDGKTFDSGNGISFPLTSVVQGWQEGIQLMKEGAKYRFTVPPHLGYGSQGRPGIPPNSTLMFDVDLLEVEY